MKKFIFAALLLAMSLAPAVGQSVVKHYWDEIPLTWSAFSKHHADDSVKTEIVCFFECQPAANKVGRLNVYDYDLQCGMESPASWVDPDYMTPQYLSYNQVLFNLGELICRQLQPLVTNSQRAREVPAAALQHWQRSAAWFVMESDNGRRPDVVARWNDSILNLLQSTPQHLSPKIKKGWGADFVIGLGFLCFTSDKLDLVNPSGSLNAGFDLLFGRHHFGIWAQTASLMSYSDLSLVYDYGTEVYRKGYPMSINSTFFRYGFTALESSSLRLVPFVGIGTASLRFPSRFIYESTAFAAGLALDWRINATEDFLVSPPFCKEFDVQLSASVIWQPRQDVVGLCLNFGLSFGGLIQHGR